MILHYLNSYKSYLIKSIVRNKLTGNVETKSHRKSKFYKLKEKLEKLHFL